MNKKVIEVVESLMEQHPEYKEELKELRAAYENPLSRFCENEAVFRLAECFSLDPEEESFHEIAEELENELYMDDYVINGERCEELTRSVLQDYSMIINSFEDIVHAKKEPKPYINLERSSMDLLAYMLCEERGISDLDLQIQISQELQCRYSEVDFISYRKLKEGFEMELMEYYGQEEKPQEEEMSSVSENNKSSNRAAKLNDIMEDIADIQKLLNEVNNELDEMDKLFE